MLAQRADWSRQGATRQRTLVSRREHGVTTRVELLEREAELAALDQTIAAGAGRKRASGGHPRPGRHGQDTPVGVRASGGG